MNPPKVTDEDYINFLIAMTATEAEHVINKDHEDKSKTDHFAEMLMQAHERGFEPQFVCFDS